MPRKKKKRRGGAARERDRKIAGWWSDRIRAGLKKQEKYRDDRQEVLDYLGADHESLFNDPETTRYFMNFEGSSAISVPKIAQMRNSLGPRLHYAKPVRTITPYSDDGVMQGLAKVLQEYLAYTARETKLGKQLRKAIDDGLLGGRAILQQGWDPVRKVVTSRYLPSTSLVFDPDYDDIEDAKWIAIRYREPFWETDRRVGEKWRLKDLHKRASVEKDMHHNPEETDHKELDIPGTSDMVAYWVVLSKMGKGWRGVELSEEKTRQKDTQDFVRLEIVLDHHTPLDEGKWDVPLYLDKEWPIAYVDFVEPVDSQWPLSVSGQVMGSQKAVDLLSSLRLTSCKNRDRFVAIVDSRLGKLNQQQLRNGTSADLLSCQVPNGMRLEDLVKVLEFGQGSVESDRERDFHLQQIEVTTGVTQAMHGGEDAGPQDRSATASRMRNAATDVRTADLQQRVEELSTDAARKEALIVRLDLDEDEVKPFVRTSKIQMYYIHIEVPGGGVVPVRDFGDPDEDGVLALNHISPASSNYWPTPEEAFAAASDLFLDMQESEDPRIQQLFTEMMREGIAEEDGLPVAMEVLPVTVERVWEDTAGLSPSELMREFGYEIASGSGLKINREQERENADDLVQTVLPTMIGNMDYEGANKVMQIRQDAYEVPQDQRVTLNPPPPPPEQGPPQ